MEEEDFIEDSDVKVGYRFNIITGCTILDNGKVLFSEYTAGQCTNCVSLNDRHGNYTRTVRALDTYYEPYNDINNIDTNTIAVSTRTCMKISNIDMHLIIQNIKNNKLCYGITHCDGKLYDCHEKEGIQRFDFKTKFSSLLVPTKDVDFHIFQVTEINCFTHLTQKP